ncbi:MAG TPA: hypothetical protein VFV09_00850 [Actinomycetota bacterium]|jgi:hypothetical protein|nr:hypothetical protein [Actinomycetota bacterium]
MTDDELPDIETAQDEGARLYRDMRRKGVGKRTLQALRETWAEACMDPMRRGVLRDPPAPDKISLDGPYPEVKPHRDLGNMLEPNPPSMKDLLSRTEPFDPTGEASHPSD